MTEFEQRVYDALRDLVVPSDASDSYRWQRRCETLAPRVAAAIDDAVYEFARSAGDPTNDSPTYQQAALAALRGA